MADALKALKKNGFHLFYSTKNKFGMEKKHFSKDFKKVADKPHVYNNMLVEEKNVTVSSTNGREHAILFVDMLNKSIRYAQIVCPSKYKEAMDLYVNVAKKPTRKLRFVQLKDDDDMSTDSDDSTPHRKRGKQEDTSMTYSNRFYTFFLGVQVNATPHGDLFWMKRDTMHSLFKKLMGKGANVSELQGI